MNLSEIAKLLESEQKRADERVIITNENGHADESFMLGTRDAYANLARHILLSIIDVEECGETSQFEGGKWSGEVVFAFNQLPCETPSITGCHVFTDNSQVTSAAIEATSWVSDISKIKNDPDFN